jgi:RNase P subunit RPR2
MSALQKFMLRILPKRWAEEMEAEAQMWMLRCSSCGFEHSLWEAGGIRWKSSKNSKTATVLRCQQCGKRAIHTVHYGQQAQPS